MAARTEEAGVHGFVAPGFEAVRAAFEANFDKRGEVGASFSAFQHGQLVVELWGGLADKATKRPWEKDTLATVFSVTKGLAAACLLILADRGDLDYDAPLTEYWPEVGRGGKAGITVRQLLNHRSGLVALETPLSIADFESWDPVVDAMCAQEPLWEPGTSQGYHGITFGPYVSELFRRVAKESLGAFLKREIAEPLGADVHVGLPEALDSRVATIYPVTPGQRIMKALPYVMFNKVVERKLLSALAKKTSTTSRAFAQPADLGAKGLHNFNLPRVRRLELPWANGIATATGLATVYAALANGGEHDGKRLVSAKAVEALVPRQSFEETDEVLRKPVGWSQGFLKEERHLFSPVEASFGHAGLGGALGWCDPTNGLSWGYTLNKLDFRLRSPRALALSHALYKSLERAGT